jgi:hypothetical protein
MIDFTEEQEQQAMQPPTIDQLLLGLMYELQALRTEVYYLRETVHGLNGTLREEQ